jgi:hypothetical protein
VEAVQRRAARFVHNIYRYNPDDPESNSVTKMIQTLEWKSLQERRWEARLVLFYKAVNGLAAIPVNTYLTPAPNIYRMRHAHQHSYLIPYARTDIYKFSFFPNTVRAWNLLPAHLVTCPSTLSFRAGLQSSQLYQPQP